MLGRPEPPQRSEAGIVLIPLDRAAIDLVWHESGYPAHGDYRDTNRLTPRAHALWANDGAPYDPERGRRAGAADAADFVANVPDGAVVAFDTELFGHHWHEGVTFLEAVLEQADVVPVDVAGGGRRARRAADELGRSAATFARGAAASSPGPSAAPSWPRWAPIRPPARCGSCSRCRAPTGRS